MINPLQARDIWGGYRPELAPAMGIYQYEGYTAVYPTPINRLPAGQFRAFNCFGITDDVVAS